MARDVFVVAAMAIALAGQPATLDERSVAKFLTELQRAVARDDRTAVAALVRYPVTVFAGSIRIPIADAAAMVQSYDVVFTPALKSLIAEASTSNRGGSASAASVAIAANA